MKSWTNFANIYLKGKEYLFHLCKNSTSYFIVINSADQLKLVNSINFVLLLFRLFFRLFASSDQLSKRI